MDLFRSPRRALPWPLIVRPPDEYASEGGRFGAVRSGGRRHEGVDLLVPAGTVLIAPWHCQFIRTGLAYQNAPHLGLIVLGRTNDEQWKFLYTHAVSSLIGQAVAKGAIVATVQDLSERYPADIEHPAGMTNHVHVEKWLLRGLEWSRVDPTADIFDGAPLPEVV